MTTTSRRELVKLKYLAMPINIKLPYSAVDRPYIGLEHIQSWTGKIDFDNNAKPEGDVALFEPGDVLFGRLRPYLAKVALASYPGASSTENIILRPNYETSSAFLRYVLSEQGFIAEVDASTYGAKMPRASWEFIGSRKVPKYSITDQHRIADFLDRETARIDQLIQKKQRLVELLEEKWAAEIDTATFCGRPTRMKHLRRFVTSGSRGWGDYYADQGVKFFRITNVTGSGIDVDKESIAYVDLPPDVEGLRTRVNVGDLFVSITAELGAIAVADEACSGGFVNQHIALVRLDQRRCDPRFVAYSLVSERGRQQFSVLGYGGTKQGLSLADVGEVSVPLPSLDQQVRIRLQLDTAAAHFRELCEQVARSINKLKEFRSALITAAVTGQIDVDEWQRRESTDRRLDEIEEKMRV